MLGMLEEIAARKVNVIHGPLRPGDVRHSKANIDKAKELLGYAPIVRFEDGLKKVYNWYLRNIE